jgi:hypothetical protein
MKDGDGKREEKGEVQGCKEECGKEGEAMEAAGRKQLSASTKGIERRRGEQTHLLQVVKVVDQLQVRKPDRGPVPRQLRQPARLDE